MNTKRRVIVALTLMWGFVLILTATGCARSRGTFQIYGMGTIAVDAPFQVVVEARQAVVQRFQHYVKDDQGRNYDPTFHGSGNSWTTGGSGSQTNAVTRGRTEFEDASGQKISIEEISVTGRPTLVFLSHGNQQVPQEVGNEFIASLERQGLRRR